MNSLFKGLVEGIEEAFVRSFIILNRKDSNERSEFRSFAVKNPGGQIIPDENFYHLIDLICSK